MLSQALSLPVSAFGLTRGVPSAPPAVNKDCLLCSPFPRWPQVGALPEMDGQRWEASLCEGKVLLGVKSVGVRPLPRTSGMPWSPWGAQGSSASEAWSEFNPFRRLCHPSQV